MLVLTRRVGESIRIDDHIRITVQGKVGGHITVALTAPAGVNVTDDTDTALLPCRRIWRRRCYEATLLLGDSLRIGRDVVVWIGGGGQAGQPAKASGAQVRMGIDAPLEVAVHREEIYHRIRNAQSARRRECV